MEQCTYCNNKDICKKNNWVVTFDNGYRIDSLNEPMCDNFKLAKKKYMIYCRNNIVKEKKE